VDVPRAVGEHLAGPHPDHELRARPRRRQLVVRVDARRPVQPQPPAALERDEQQTDLGVDEHGAERDEHPVAVVARERDRPVVEHLHEPRVAALVGAVRAAPLVGRGDEQHVDALDERPVVVVDPVGHLALLEPIGEPARVEVVLQGAAALVVEAVYAHSIGS